MHLVGEVVEPDELMPTPRARSSSAIAAAPREVLVRTKAKALRRAGFAAEYPHPRPLTATRVATSHSIVMAHL